MTRIKLPEPCPRGSSTPIIFPTALQVARLAARARKGAGQPYGVDIPQPARVRADWLLRMGYIRHLESGILQVSTEPWSERKGDCVVPHVPSLLQALRKRFGHGFDLEPEWCVYYNEYAAEGAPKWIETSEVGCWLLSYSAYEASRPRP